MEEASLDKKSDDGAEIAKMDAFTYSANAAAVALERLDKALDGVSAKLKALSGSPHGGITFEMVGDVARAEIKPQESGSPQKLTLANTVRIGKRAKVMLDGIEVDGVEAEPCGYVVVPKLDANGNFSIGDDDNIVYEKKFGVVTTEILD